MGASNIIVSMMIEMIRNKITHFLLAIILLTSCREAPVTERKQLILIPESRVYTQKLMKYWYSIDSDTTRQTPCGVSTIIYCLVLKNENRSVKMKELTSLSSI